MLGWSHSKSSGRRKTRPVDPAAEHADRQPGGSASVQRLLVILGEHSLTDEIHTDRWDTTVRFS